MKDSPLIKLVMLRKTVCEKEVKIAAQTNDGRAEEVENLKKANSVLTDRIKANEELILKNLNAMRYEIGERDKEISACKKEIYLKEAERLKLQKEVSRYQELLNEAAEERKEMERAHQAHISDLRLKHDQEVYILKKIKKN